MHGLSTISNCPLRWTPTQRRDMFSTLSLGVYPEWYHCKTHLSLYTPVPTGLRMGWQWFGWERVLQHEWSWQRHHWYEWFPWQHGTIPLPRSIQSIVFWVISSTYPHVNTMFDCLGVTQDFLLWLHPNRSRLTILLRPSLMVTSYRNDDAIAISNNPKSDDVSILIKQDIRCSQLLFWGR